MFRVGVIRFMSGRRKSRAGRDGRIYLANDKDASFFASPPFPIVSFASVLMSAGISIMLLPMIWRLPCFCIYYVCARRAFDAFLSFLPAGDVPNVYLEVIKEYTHFNYYQHGTFYQQRTRRQEACGPTIYRQAPDE